MLDLDSFMTDWRPPITKVVASQNEGIDELIASVEKHRAYIEGNGELAKRRTKRTKDEMLDILNSSINAKIKQEIVENGRLDSFVDDIKNHKTDPYTVVGNLLNEMLK